MRKFSKGELKQLKWRLISQDGLSVSQADKRINDLIDFEKNLDKVKKPETIKTLKQKLNKDMERLRKL